MPVYLGYKYKLHDIDDTSDPIYFGYTNQENRWYIAQFDSTSGPLVIRYAKGVDNYDQAWSNKASLSYGIWVE